MINSHSEIEVIEDDSFDFQGFQVVRGEFFSHIFEPSFTFSDYKVHVNTACIKKLPDIDYIQILINPATKKLAVKPCLEDAKDSFRWCSATEKRSPKQITCRLFFAKVFSLMDWNPDYRYKLLGKLIRSNNELLFVYDLNNPEIFQRSIQKDGKKISSRTPAYPEDWMNQFGLSYEEHKSAMQVNIVDGYVIVNTERKQQSASHISEHKSESEVNTNEQLSLTDIESNNSN